MSKRPLPGGSEQPTKRFHSSSASARQDPIPHPTIVASGSHHAPRDLPSPNELQTATIAKKPTCYRIQNIPKTWTLKALLKKLQTKYCSLEIQASQISLLPSYSNPNRNTALLKLPDCHEIFESRVVHNIPDGDIDLEIDSHFHGLTQLNTPENDADIVAE